MNIIKRGRELLRSTIERSPRLAASIRSARETWNANASSKESPLGFTLAGNAMMAEGKFEAEETSLIQDLLKDVDILINVGANVGYYCMIAAKMDKEVIAFEPLPSNLHLLLRNITENGFGEKTQVFPLALGEKPGILKIYGKGTGASLIAGWAGTSEAFFQLAPISTLDRIIGCSLAGKKALILIDVEGAEFPVLLGGIQTAKNLPMPSWFVEISFHEHQPEGVQTNPNFLKTFELFWELGYDSFVATDPPVRMDKASIYDAIEKNSEMPSRNFLFVPTN